MEHLVNYLMITNLLITLIVLFLLTLIIIYIFINKILKYLDYNSVENIKPFSDKRFIKFDSFLIEVFNNIDLSLFKKTKISKVYLVKGTFVGDDPFFIFNWLEEILPFGLIFFINKIKKIISLIIKKYPIDTGFFTQKYIEDLKEHLHEDTDVVEFEWSSANHHIARVEGMVDFINELITSNKREDILCIGHSHAGQIFILLNLFLGNSKKTSSFHSFLIKHSYFTSDEITSKQNILYKKKINVLTMGTSVRYPFGNFNNINFIHLINYKMETISTKVNWKGIISSSYGDYIRILAQSGSDFLVPSKTDQIKNLELNTILDTGSNLKIWKNKIQNPLIFQDKGLHLFIGIDGEGYTLKGFRDVFGHGVYTRESLLTNILKICYIYLYK